MFSDIQFVVIQVKELQLELTCKDGVLKAMKLTSMVSLTSGSSLEKEIN